MERFPFSVYFRLFSCPPNGRHGITTAQELASPWRSARWLYRDPTFWKGNNGTAVYNNSGNGMVTITREQDTARPQ